MAWERSHSLMQRNNEILWETQERSWSLSGYLDNRWLKNNSEGKGHMQQVRCVLEERKKGGRTVKEEDKK